MEDNLRKGGIEVDFLKWKEQVWHNCSLRQYNSPSQDACNHPNKTNYCCMENCPKISVEDISNNPI